MNSSRAIRFGAFAASVLAFSLVGGGFARAASSATVYAQDIGSGWHPATVSIDAGGTVTWENRDQNNPHTVQCDQHDSNAPCPWSNAPNMNQRANQFSTPEKVFISFPTTGTYAYYCSIHPGMTGTVVVGSGRPPASSKPTPTASQTKSVSPAVRATTSTAPSASTSARASAKATPKTTVKGKILTKPAPSLSGKALGETSSKGNSPGAGILVPAALLIALVGGGHFARARRRSA